MPQLVFKKLDHHHVFFEYFQVLAGILSNDININTSYFEQVATSKYSSSSLYHETVKLLTWSTNLIWLLFPLL